MSTAIVEPGTALGKCEIVREIGRGGMAAVYLGRHSTLEIDVAVKVLYPTIAQGSRRAVQRFMREGRLAARLRHPNLVGVIDADIDEKQGLWFLVMEFVDGPSIAELIDRKPLSPRSAAAVLVPVCHALQAIAESEIVHRDVKPSNILIDREGTVKLADLGLARALRVEEWLTTASLSLGTPMYMSPEHVSSPKVVDIRSDLFSLGVSFYEMLTGDVPYNEGTFFEVGDQILHGPIPDARAVVPDLDPLLVALMQRLLAKKPADRPQRPVTVAEELTAFLGGEQAVADENRKLVASRDGAEPHQRHEDIADASTLGSGTRRMK